MLHTDDLNMDTGGNVKKSRRKCNKGGGTFAIDKCHLAFCLKRTSDYRQGLSQQIDNIAQLHNQSQTRLRSMRKRIS